ncbi:MAG: hypothetical protein RTV31_13555 [Candidatus Thorarchaeota archaeon]
MNEQFTIRFIHSVEPEPDYIGINGPHRSPIKTFLGVLIVSIAICSIAMKMISGYMTIPGHVFWIFFHIFYIGGLVYFFGKKWKQQSAEMEV